MQSPQEQNLEPNTITQAVQRCCEAYYRFLEENPKPPKGRARDNYDEEEMLARAAQAYLRHIPFLDSLENTLAVVACVHHAMLLGIIDPADSGRHVNLIQLSFSHFRPKSEPRPVGRPKQLITPSPQEEAAKVPAWGDHRRGILPDEGWQVAFFTELRKRGVPIPCAQDLKRHPHVHHALNDLAVNYMYVLGKLEYEDPNQPTPEPSSADPNNPKPPAEAQNEAPEAPSEAEIQAQAA